MGSMREIAEQVCAKHGVTVADIRGPHRPHKITRARHETFARIRRETSFSLPSIGRWFHKDHTTVLYGARKHDTGYRRPA